MKPIKVIDVSTWQKDIDYMKLRERNPEIKGVILRIGFTGYHYTKPMKMDELFNVHYAGFKRVGLPMGVYYYSTATTPTEAKNEALQTVDWLKDKHIDYPIWWDTEDNHDTKNDNLAPDSQFTIGAKRLTDCAIAFCNEIEKHGYYVGIYASTWWFNNCLEVDRLSDYDKWVAHYGVDVPTVKFPYGMHQYTSNGLLEGIGGVVDINNCYKDYPSIMKRMGLNGYPKGDNIPTPTPVDEYEQVFMLINEAKKSLDLAIELLQLKEAK